MAPDVGPGASVTIPKRSTRPAATQISFNFRDAPVDALLERLSEEAGFIIIKESPVSGRVTVLSKQPVTPTRPRRCSTRCSRVRGTPSSAWGGR